MGQSRAVNAWGAAAAAVVLAAAAPLREEPKLELSAERLHMIPAGLAGQGYAKRVEFHARLRGEAEDWEDYYCLDEVWDWGDGTESVYEPDCDPYEDGSEIKREFTDAHHFRPGEWYVTFALMNFDEIVLEGGFEIRVY